MLQPEVLHNQLRELFAEKLNLEVPHTETDLVEGGMIDSMTFVDLLAHLERQFGVNISSDALDLDNFRSIAKIAEFVAKNSRNGAAHPQ
jgi:acyl carrier protein